MSWIGQQCQGDRHQEGQKESELWTHSHPGLLLVWKFRSWELKGYLEKA